MKKYLIIIIFIISGGLIMSFMGAYLLTKNDGYSFGESVAIIKVHGKISMTSDSGILQESVITPQKFIELLNQANRDKSVKAILLDINSPGGSVVASDEIARAIKESEKPVVAWLSEIAASGGYYIASASDFIIADRASVVGSIGVISIFPEYSKLLEKIGVNFTIVKGGEFKDFSTGYRPMTEEEKEMLEGIVLEIYDQFLEEVANNRNLTVEYVSSIAEGKIYTGKKAKELNLIDEIGGRDLAINKAAELGEITGNPNIVSYNKKSFLDEFSEKFSANFGYGFAKAIIDSGKQFSME
jgi:protease-4